MRKIFLTMLVFAATLTATAQRTKRERNKDNEEKSNTTESSSEGGVSKIFTDNSKDLNLKSSRGESYLPEAGNWGLTFDFVPFIRYVANAVDNSKNSGNNVNSNFVGDFNGRFVGKYFVTDKKAYRVIFNLGLNNSTTEFKDSDPELQNVANNTRTVLDKTTVSKFDLALGLGKEWRRGNTRLQGYYGADVFFSLGSTSEKKETNTAGYVGTATNNTKSNSSVTIETDRGFRFGIGAQGFVGAEYFIFPKFAVGAQYTYGISYVMDGQDKVDTSTSSTVVNTAGSTVNTTNTNSSSTVQGAPRTSGFNFGGVNLVSINLSLYF